MKFTRLMFFLVTGISFEFCVAQPFTPFPVGGKTKKQNLILPLPPTTNTTGCILTIGATNAATVNGVTTVSLGTTGTRTTSQFSATKDGIAVTTTTEWTSSVPTVASISASGLVTALSAGSTSVGPVCDPSTRIVVNVVTGQATNLLEIAEMKESKAEIIKVEETETINED